MFGEICNTPTETAYTLLERCLLCAFQQPAVCTMQAPALPTELYETFSKQRHAQAQQRIQPIYPDDPGPTVTDVPSVAHLGTEPFRFRQERQLEGQSDPPCHVALHVMLPSDNLLEEPTYDMLQLHVMVPI